MDYNVATLAEAILLAVQAHYGQLDRYGRPYILHPLRVMQRVETEAEMTAAILHDIVEDTPYTLDDLRALGYAEEVVAAVDHLSRREGETYEAYIERLRPHPMARRIKLADLEDNMDLRRLDTIGEKDVERLRRYRQAWERLRQVQESG